jgi:hypothetical protein
MIKIAIPFILLLMISSVASAEAMYSVGISPNFADLGEVERGSSHSVTFRVFSRSSETLLVFMEDYRAGVETIKAKQPALMQGFSEEDASSWITFMKNPTEIGPAAGEERNWSDFSFFINIPNNAEPGYHAVMLRPSIYVPEQNMGRVGSRVVGVTSFLVVFRVSGKAERNGIILDTVRSSQSSSQVELSTYFQNTGTMTLYAKAFNAVSDSKAESASEKIAPQEIKVMKSYLRLSGLDCQDSCSVSTEVDYSTGKAESSSIISLAAPFIPVSMPKPGAGIDLTLIAMIAGIVMLVIILARRFLYEE